jgi:hypothetical protein
MITLVVGLIFTRRADRSFRLATRPEQVEDKPSKRMQNCKQRSIRDSSLHAHPGRMDFCKGHPESALALRRSVKDSPEALQGFKETFAQMSVRHDERRQESRVTSMSHVCCVHLRHEADTMGISV